MPAGQNRGAILSVRMEGSLQELDETSYWLENLAEAEIMPQDRLIDLIKETDELLAIFVSSVKTVKKNK